MTEVLQKPPLPYSSILVTGADGFVGRHLVPLLSTRLRRDARLVASAGKGVALQGASRHVELDLREPGSVETIIREQRPDLVIHLAAQSSIGQSAELASASWEINLVGTFYLARSIASLVPEATMLFISSAEVYGRTFNLETATESSELRPQSVYARTKAAAEAVLADVLPQTSRLVVARPSNHSGPGQDTRFVLPAFAEQIARIEAGLADPVVHVGNLEAERDFMDVRDVVRAYDALLTTAPALPMRSTFNIASGTTRPIRYFLERLLSMSRRPADVQADPARLRPSEIPRAALDASAIRALTGWQPAISTDQILESLLRDQRDRVGSATD
jgi:GDP-4-dehydro-6-deoxy-D-mannose reductase